MIDLRHLAQNARVVHAAKALKSKHYQALPTRKEFSQGPFTPFSLLVHSFPSVVWNIS